MFKKIILIWGFAFLSQTIQADLWQDLAAYKYGAESNAADALDKLVASTPPDGYGAIEVELIKIVSSDAATTDGKHWACRMLQRIGTDKSIPALSRLLHQEKLSHYARLALEEMTLIPAAGDALRAALEGAPESVIPGLVGSLGVRRDQKAVNSIGEFASHPNPEVAKASLRALGYIGGPKSLKAIQKAKATEATQTTKLEAIVRCAASLPASEASAVLSAVLANQEHPANHRLAALNTLVKKDASKGAQAIIAFIKSDEHSYLRQGAFRQVVSGKGPELTAALTKALGSFNPDARAQTIELLGTRGDKSAVAGIRPYLKSDEPATRAAAIKAIGAIGGPAEVKALVAVAKGDDANKVNDALVKMHGNGINEALAALLSEKGLQITALAVLGKRGARNVGSQLVKMAGDANPDVRKAAWSSMAQLASADQIGSLMPLLIRISDGGERSLAQNALKNICSEAPDRNKAFDVIAGFYDQAEMETQLYILDLGASVGTDKALELERKALKSDNADMRKKALRALSAWPNEAPAEDLLDLAKNANSDSDKILALRGYIQVAAKGGSDKSKLAKCETASKLVTRKEEKRLIVSTLRNIKRVEGLNALKAYLADGDVKNEAEVAAIDLAWDIRKQWPEDVAALAQSVMDTSKNKRVVNKAKSCLKETQGKKNRK